MEKVVSENEKNLSLSQKNENENENNFTQMSNHLKYEDPTLSNQQAANATQLLQNG
jgi:hypothetical protein